MPNGKYGDHPITDILIHGRRVYSKRADDLIRKIVELGGRSEIDTLLLVEYNDWGKPDVKKLEGVLTGILEHLLAEGGSKKAGEDR
jgi:hypothetical protein